MKNNIYTSVCGGLLLLLLGAMPVMAQDNSDLTPAALEKIKLNSIWQNTYNAAGAVLEQTPKYSFVDARYQSYNGNFHRPQQAESGTNLKFTSEGNMILNKTRVWGYFTYKRDNINGTKYNSSIIDPYRGMPFYVADTVPSDWRNQYYDLGFRVAHPLTEHWAIGFDAAYKAYLGAKQRDPRTENEFMQLVLNPSVVYSINANNHIGANFNYYSLKEQSEMSNVNYYTDQIYYEMYGLGTAAVGLGSGRTTNYVANNVGGGLQYHHQGCVNVLLEGSYNLKVEDVQISFSTPRDDSSTRDQMWKGLALFTKDCNDYSNFLQFTYINRQIKGIQYITQRDNSEAQTGWNTLYSSVRSKYRTNDLKADYTLLKKRDNEYAWKVNASILYDNQKDEYLLPYSDKKYENIKFNLGGKYNWALSDKAVNRLLLGADFFCNRNCSGEYKYGGSHANYLVVTDFETNDLNYLTSNYYGVNLSAVYSQRVKSDVKADVYARANFNYSKTSDFYYNHRSVFEFSIGCNF
jgi:hypothetical protein